MFKVLEFPYKKKINNTFGMNVLITISGTVIAQSIPILLMPLLTRLYSPSDFGVFSLYVALATLCSVIATARYEIAIMQPKSDIGAVNLLALSMLISLIISLLLFLILFFFKQQIILLIGNPSIASLLFIIPITVFFTGIFQSLSYWNSRKQQFSQIAIAKIYQNAGLSGFQLVLSNTRAIHIGLPIGYIWGSILSVLYLLRTFWKKERKLINSISKIRIISYLIKYKNFPIYSLWGALFDNAAIQMPIFILSKFYNAELTGFFNLTFRALNLPMILVATSLSQVLFQKINSMSHKNSIMIRQLIVKIFFILLSLSLPFVFIIFFWGKDLFIFFFGDEWFLSGQYASILVFAIAIRFAVSPLSIVLALNHNLRLGFLWQFIYFCTIVITLFIAAKYNIDTFIITFVIHEIILYLLYFYFILIGSKTISK